MVLNLFRRRPRRTAVTFDAPIRAPGLVYAIGDIHGRDDLLRELIGRVTDDAAGRDATIVFMGDYIDRGENARETLDFLIRFGTEAPGETVFLMGNHEQMLLRFLRDPGTGVGWLRYGGLQTLMSYGVGHAGSLKDAESALRLRADLAEALGDHLGFIEGLRVSHRIGNVFFAHAGADPGRAIDDQDVQTLLWGTEAFAAKPRDDGVWVVYGHYVVETAVADQGRIAVDTGAYFSNRLTAARIADGAVTFLQT